MIFKIRNQVESIHLHSPILYVLRAILITSSHLILFCWNIGNQVESLQLHSLIYFKARDFARSPAT